jgi:hypothetical protein
MNLVVVFLQLFYSLSAETIDERLAKITARHNELQQRIIDMMRKEYHFNPPDFRSSVPVVVLGREQYVRYRMQKDIQVVDPGKLDRFLELRKLSTLLAGNYDDKSALFYLLGYLQKDQSYVQHVIIPNFEKILMHYDQENNTIVINKDSCANLSDRENTKVFVHELIHAYQAQVYNSYIYGNSLTTDQINALSGFREGEAVFFECVFGKYGSDATGIKNCLEDFKEISSSDFSDPADNYRRSALRKMNMDTSYIAGPMYVVEMISRYDKLSTERIKGLVPHSTQQLLYPGRFLPKPDFRAFRRETIYKIPDLVSIKDCRDPDFFKLDSLGASELAKFLSSRNTGTNGNTDYPELLKQWDGDNFLIISTAPDHNKYLIAGVIAWKTDSASSAFYSLVKNDQIYKTIKQGKLTILLRNLGEYPKVEELLLKELATLLSVK